MVLSLSSNLGSPLDLHGSPLDLHWISIWMYRIFCTNFSPKQRSVDPIHPLSMLSRADMQKERARLNRLATRHARVFGFDSSRLNVPSRMPKSAFSAVDRGRKPKNQQKHADAIVGRRRVVTAGKMRSVQKKCVSVRPFERASRTSSHLVHLSVDKPEKLAVPSIEHAAKIERERDDGAHLDALTAALFPGAQRFMKPNLSTKEQAVADHIEESMRKHARMQALHKGSTISTWFGSYKTPEEAEAASGSCADGDLKLDLAGEVDLLQLVARKQMTQVVLSRADLWDNCVDAVITPVVIYHRFQGKAAWEHDAVGEGGRKVNHPRIRHRGHHVRLSFKKYGIFYATVHAEHLCFSQLGDKSANERREVESVDVRIVQATGELGGPLFHGRVLHHVRWRHSQVRAKKPMGRNKWRKKIVPLIKHTFASRIFQHEIIDRLKRADTREDIEKPLLLLKLMCSEGGVLGGDGEDAASDRAFIHNLLLETVRTAPSHLTRELLSETGSRLSPGPFENPGASEGKGEEGTAGADDAERLSRLHAARVAEAAYEKGKKSALNEGLHPHHAHIRGIFHHVSGQLHHHCHGPKFPQIVRAHHRPEEWQHVLELLELGKESKLWALAPSAELHASSQSPEPGAGDDVELDIERDSEEDEDKNMVRHPEAHFLEQAREKEELEEEYSASDTSVDDSLLDMLEGDDELHSKQN